MRRVENLPTTRGRLDAFSGADPRQLERTAHNLLPGQVLVEAQHAISTLLGSCIAVCLFDPTLRLLGMNHFLLPHMKRTTDTNEANLSGMASMECLVNAMMKQGAKKSRLQAKAFGGAHLLNTNHSGAPGERNIRFTTEWLAAEQIPLLAMDLGGHRARKIVGDPNTGEVHCRHLSHSLSPQQKVVRQENEYELNLLRALEQRHIDFF